MGHKKKWANKQSLDKKKDICESDKLRNLCKMQNENIFITIEFFTLNIQAFILFLFHIMS